MNYEEQLLKYDKSKQYSVLRAFPSHVREGIEIGEACDLEPIESFDFENVVVCGMGGSAIGGDILRGYALKYAQVPISVNRNYTLPNYVSSSTLVCVVSYSGGTEESLSAYEDAKRRDARIFVITSGGELAKRASRDGVLTVFIPGGLAPRAAVGYLFCPLLVIARRLGLLTGESADLPSLLRVLESHVERLSTATDELNPAIGIAEKLVDSLPVIYSAQNYMEPVAIRWKCQIEENAKTLSYNNVFPELNHNEIVGWEQNPDLLKKISVLVFQDPDDLPEIKTRIEVTAKLISPYAKQILPIPCEGSNELEKVFLTIALGDWVSFYLAMRTGTDPFPIEKIHALKTALEQSHHT